MRRPRHLLLALCFGLFLALPATAAPLGRPVWWKVSNGAGSTLWILGIPNGVLDTLEWNHDALDHRLDLAGGVIMPMLQDEGGLCKPGAIRTFPGGDAAECQPLAWTTHMVVPPLGVIYWDDPISGRLPADLAARAAKALPSMLGDPNGAVRHARIMDLALWLDLWNWPRGGLFHDIRLGNKITLQAADLAEKRGLKPVVVPQPRLWLPVFASAYRGEVTPPEALQQKCLAQVLDQTESGQMPERRMAAQQAWADGDLDHALRRTGTVQYCLMGGEATTGVRDYLKNAAYRYYTSLDKAFDRPGQTVALVEFDPLLLDDGGVLDHFRRLGYDITISDGME
ncbi:MAG: polysaccharide biosynthesis protein GumN [Caulobacteraceae bacterium]|nr:polysaccharide biosynthesis protein GumN [Caulobacteraceae bacterium]